MTLTTMLKKVLLAVMAFFVSLGLSAQRTAKAQLFVDAGASLSFPEVTVGAQAGIGQYRSGFYWDAGLAFLSDRVYFSNGERAPFVDYLAGGGAFWRALGTRSRSFNFYLGGHGFLGAELYDPANRLDASMKTLSDGSVFGGVQFVYGCAPSVLVEFFFWDRLALTGSFNLPVVVNSRVSLFRYVASVGLRYNL